MKDYKKIISELQQADHLLESSERVDHVLAGAKLRLAIIELQEWDRDQERELDMIVKDYEQSLRKRLKAV